LKGHIRSASVPPRFGFLDSSHSPRIKDATNPFKIVIVRDMGPGDRARGGDPGRR